MTKISFRINYHTNWGERIVVVGDDPGLGEGKITDSLSLNYSKDGFWEGMIAIEKTKKILNYKYCKVDEKDIVLDEEWGDDRQLKLSDYLKEKIALIDTWRAKHHDENSLYTSAFKEVIFKPTILNSKPQRKTKPSHLIHFQMNCPRVISGMQLCICGNIPELGEWDLSKPVLLKNYDFPKWTAQISINEQKAFEYKYGVFDPVNKKVLFIEKGANREFKPTSINSNVIVKSDEYFNHPDGHWKGIGVAIPVFSLRSKSGLGVGEFRGIPALVDWAKRVNMNMVQILPINDTIATNTWVDSYPYAAISVFALHPLYLNIEEIEGFNDVIDIKVYNKEKTKLNKLAEVDYEKIIQLKFQYARAIFNNEKKSFLNSKAFIYFLKQNEKWLKPYALFCCFRDKYKTPDFNKWEKEKEFSNALLNSATNPKSKEYDQISFYYFLQFHLDKQLKSATDYARNNGIVLKGDIPIGIYRYSVDAWTEPHLYNMDGQSGAPPDPFSDIGQNWGFPTYNWEEMAKDGFQWWQNRFRQLSRYFDAFRIDHILGFFRIWQIPIEQIEGTFGYFNPAIPIRIEEFYKKGISFEYNRFCKPYITIEILNYTFGHDALWIVENILEKLDNGRFSFKSTFDTQRKLASFFDKLKDKSKIKLKDQLFKLQSNVLFFEVKDSNKSAYHPRIDFQNTLSFKALDNGTQQKLREMYMDYFYKRQDEFWREQAMSKLPAMKAATNMLICGEDLGMVPDCVPGVMKELDILSLEIQRMSKNPKTEFLQPQDIPYLSVCTPGTHDMSPLRLWWQEMEPAQRNRFFKHQLGLLDEPPFNCEPYVVERIFKQHLAWPSMWVVFSIQDIFALKNSTRRENPEEERINVPANPQHYWRYRMHISIEDLIENEELSDNLRTLLQETGRG